MASDTPPATLEIPELEQALKPLDQHLMTLGKASADHATELQELRKNFAQHTANVKEVTQVHAAIIRGHEGRLAQHTATDDSLRQDDENLRSLIGELIGQWNIASAAQKAFDGRLSRLEERLDRQWTELSAKVDGLVEFLREWKRDEEGSQCTELEEREAVEEEKKETP
ncbi:hypothetical protein B0A49_00187 [Cryomyces minteri]|uniref:Uncharacterized protein n=1 Tax=Cryomyces minteri TaxID=331657 RepID=A0A4U0XWG8_9PEZI|nr:hypothetical protein B0A49_00187 [Cryomyces minteri]